MIDLFADATHDHQFIHVDRGTGAKAESPFGGTIAHGFLTLSLLSAMNFDCVLKDPRTDAWASITVSSASASCRRSRAGCPRSAAVSTLDRHLPFRGAGMLDDHL